MLLVGQFMDAAAFERVFTSKFRYNRRAYLLACPPSDSNRNPLHASRLDEDSESIICGGVTPKRVQLLQRASRDSCAALTKAPLEEVKFSSHAWDFGSDKVGQLIAGG
ncbi:hypothetical protein LIA77_07456 [Sarocladium implicatum]|nr:hypothetical protein LIA77_07456 [Sarocladium implicatum]